MKFFLSIFFCCGMYCLVDAQQIEENTFQQSENATTGTTSSAIGSAGGEQVQGGNPPNEQDPIQAPIDGYIPLLAGVALGMMVYHYKCKSKKITS